MTDQPTLARILRMPASEGSEFLDALHEWVMTPERNGIPIEQLPEPARMILVLHEVYAALFSSGMTYVMDWSIGEQFHAVVKWARRIGATRTVEYFTVAAAHFPRKRVPADQKARLAVLEGLDEDGELFVDLDARYREKVLAELPRKLRAWLKANQPRVERALSKPARAARGASPGDVIPYDSVRGSGDAIASSMELQRKYDVVAAEGRLKEEGLPPEVVQIGDLVEVRSRRGFFYLHATHEHPAWRVYGPVMRVLPGFHRPALTTFAAIVGGPTAFFAVVDINGDIASRRARVVGRFPVPPAARAFPTFRYGYGRSRDGRTAWRLWRGGETGEDPVMVEPLTPEQRALPVFEPMEAEYIGDKLKEGGHPEVDVQNPELYE